MHLIRCAGALVSTPVEVLANGIEKTYVTRNRVLAMSCLRTDLLQPFLSVNTPAAQLTVERFTFSVCGAYCFISVVSMSSNCTLIALPVGSAIATLILYCL